MASTLEYNSITPSIKTKPKKKYNKNVFMENFSLTILALPTILLLFVFNYLPMGGLILAFKDFQYDLGIFGSHWNGLKNLNFFFSSLDAWRITRNTLGYGFAFIVIGIAGAVILALLLFEVKNRIALKFFQTAITIPRFLSWVIVSYISYVFLSPTQGVLTHMLTFFGMDSVNWFTEIKAWPVILIIFNLWKHIGLDAIIYYAALMGVDTELYEAGKIDGANRWQQTWNISIPSLIPLAVILGILALSNIFRGDFGLFFQIPRDVGLLYPTTDIIDTYIYRGLRGGDIGPAAAVGFFQSVVGLITVVIANSVVKKISPENSLY